VEDCRDLGNQHDINTLLVQGNAELLFMNK